MSPGDWDDLSTVYQAGADSLRGYIGNIQDQHQADSLEAMAERCHQVAVERNTLDEERLEDLRRAGRQRFVVRGSRLQCRVLVREEGRDGRTALCELHRDHVQDGTPHQLQPPPEPRRGLAPPWGREEEG